MAEERVQRRLAAILAADVVGYSRLMREDKMETLAQLMTLRKELLDPKVGEYGGRIVKTTGDGTGVWRRALAALVAVVCVAAGDASAGGFKDDWQVTGFWGKTSTNQTVGQMLAEGDFGIHSDSGLAGIGVSRRLWTVWDHLDIEAEAQTVRHYRAQTHWEFVGVLIARWTKFPWDKYVDTTMAIGDGVSHATEIPQLELERHGPDETEQTLNYLFAEVTVRPPGTENWALAFRFHHRSGVFKLIGNVTEGSGSFLLALKFGL